MTNNSKVCLNCRNLFFKKPKYTYEEWSRAVWCSIECRKSYHSKKRVNRQCEYCDKNLSLQPNQVRNRNFCSFKCQRLGSRGPNANYYLGENATTPLRKRIRQLVEYDIWHKKVMEKDSYACQRCGIRGGKLTVDHIKRFHDILLENNIKTVDDARDCKELWNTENGRVVCRICFYKLDTHGMTGLIHPRNKKNKNYVNT